MMDIFSQVEQNKLKTLEVTIAFWITYLVLKAGYNLFFHPLRRFPGPKLAAIGPYYEFYFDVVRDGMFIWETKRLHEKYGPIVRVNANELHVYDPQYYSTIYAGNQRRVDKYAEAVAAFSVPRASLATIYHNVHRLRRSILNPYFSKASVQRLESSIQERLDRLCSRLECAMKNGMTADLDAAFAALTADIVSTYFYGKTFDYLGSGEFKFEMREAILGLIDFYHFTRFFPWVANTIKKLPVPIIRLIHPGAAYLVASQEEIKMDIQRSLKNEDKSFFKSVMVQALTDESIPSEEREINRLGDEGTTIIFAGTETTARALSIGMYHILSNKDILSKLRKELDTVPGVSNGVYTHAQLECLPYLTAIVQESLRLSHGPSIRLPRVSPDQDLKYGDWVIPKGTPVSQSTILVHLNPSIFPEPLRFEPERWIKAAREGVNLDKFITAFTKGTRQCLGINLAYAEIYLTYARLVRTFDMQVHDTTQEDTLVYHIRLTGVPKKGRGEVKVKIMEKLL